MENIEKIRTYWVTEIRPLIEKCTEGYDVLLQIEDGDFTDEQKKALAANLETKFGKRDWTSVWYIGQMAGNAERHLFKNRSPAMAVLQARGTLTSESFYQNVFNNEKTEETENYRALGEKLDELLKL